MTTARILLTRRWPEAVEQALAEHFDLTRNTSDIALTEAQLLELVGDYDAICPCVTDSIDKKLLDCAGNKKLRLIANYGVGYDHIDVKAAGDLDITVTNTPDVLTECTADLAMALMLMVARRAGEGERSVRSGQWGGWYPTHMMGSMVSGKTLGIIGMGRIGMAMARKAAFGFGMNILYHNRSPADDPEIDRLQARYCENLDDLLQEADFVALHCPSSPATRHIINGERLAKMRPGAILINTARGNVVDEQALIEALRSRRIRGAGLDVYAGEPHVPDELLALENVVLLPHLGSATLETRTAMGMRVLQNLKAFFQGEIPPDLVS